MPYADTETNRIYAKNRYERLKSRGRCIVCGGRTETNAVRCDDCKIKASASTGRWQKKRKAALLEQIAELQREVAELRARLQEAAAR